MKTCPRCKTVAINDDDKFCESCNKKIVQKAKKIINSNLQHRNKINQSDSLRKGYYIIFNGIILSISVIFFILPFSIFLIMFLFFLPVILFSGNITIRNLDIH